MSYVEYVYCLLPLAKKVENIDVDKSERMTPESVPTVGDQGPAMET